MPFPQDLPSRVPCQCCGHRTVLQPAGFEHCPICGWEDDQAGRQTPDEPSGGPNGPYSLTKSRENYRRFGCHCLPTHTVNLSHEFLDHDVRQAKRLLISALEDWDLGSNTQPVSQASERLAEARERAKERKALRTHQERLALACRTIGNGRPGHWRQVLSSNIARLTPTQLHALNALGDLRLTLDSSEMAAIDDPIDRKSPQRGPKFRWSRAKHHVDALCSMGFIEQGDARQEARAGHSTLLQDVTLTPAGAKGLRALHMADGFIHLRLLARLQEQEDTEGDQGWPLG